MISTGSPGTRRISAKATTLTPTSVGISVARRASSRRIKPPPSGCGGLPSEELVLQGEHVRAAARIGHTRLPAAAGAEVAGVVDRERRVLVEHVLDHAGHDQVLDAGEAERGVV